MTIRLEQPTDYREVENLTREAFVALPIIAKFGDSSVFIRNKFGDSSGFLQNKFGDLKKYAYLCNPKNK